MEEMKITEKKNFQGFLDLDVIKGNVVRAQTSTSGILHSNIYSLKELESDMQPYILPQDYEGRSENSSGTLQAPETGLFAVHANL